MSRLGRANRRPRRDVGSVTAEMAVALPVVVLFLMAGLTAVTGVLTQLRCVDAAREGARAGARGDPPDGAAGRAAPPGAAVVVSVQGDTVRVVVRSRVRPLGPFMPPFTVEGSAVAVVEPGSLPT